MCVCVCVYVYVCVCVCVFSHHSTGLIRCRGVRLPKRCSGLDFIGWWGFLSFLTWSLNEGKPHHNFLIDICSCKMVNTLPSDIFNTSTISRSFNLRSAIKSLWSFLVFSETTAEFGQPESSASFVSVRQRFKSAYHLLSIVSDVTLIKPLLCLNSISSHQKAMLDQHTKFRFFHCFENLQL